MKFYQKEQLKDSRIFFDKKPPLFGTIFILATGLLVALALFASSVIHKPYVVRAQGIVSTSDNQYVSVNVNGTIIEMFVQEGQAVEAGQTLVKITNGQEGLQVEALKTQLEQARHQIEAMNLYQKSLEEKQNYMTNNGLEQEYYGYVNYYLSEVKGENYSNQLQIDKLKEKVNQRDGLIKGIQKLNDELHVLSIQQESSRSVATSQAEIAVKQSELDALKLAPSTSKPQNEVASDKGQMAVRNDAVLKLERDIQGLNQEVTQRQALDSQYQTLVSQISVKEKEHEGINSEIKALQEQLNNPSSQSGQTYSRLIMELGKARTAVETQITQHVANITLYGNQADTYTITAKNRGVVHYIAPLKVGMSVQQNQIIAEVSTQDSNNFVIEAHVKAADIAKVAVGDKVNVAVVGVSTSKYGTLKGQLVSIDSGTIVQEIENGKMLFYRVLVAIDHYQLKSKSDTITIMKSLPVEARIVYNEETYLEWVLELINFKE